MPKKKYMEFSDVKLKQPLMQVKRAKLKNDTLIVPKNFINAILQFLNAEDIKYHTIENPALYPKEELQIWIQRYEEVDPGGFDDENLVLLITPFDANALFEWSKQLAGETKDPSYEQYRQDRRKKADEYYRTQYEYRPD